ncbi:NAD(P)H-hydrate dehydratase [Lederbergia sp. NSJ-179]|uniref:NAD(P)H-hydrate dehydratase n=1 Tax=Lederbergia sp. NSJ-179 TaxID=2931402 RepID=UPI001FD13F41|nr:NAD(P)H-hydrate dehydratase [Lederbergia sp. NSJ-179]MCJ7840854.1 NAD(P)H-hydrate dehydratase [Lederbergia sp. NSJ-179]
MFIAGQREMQALDRYTIENIGLPGVVLMENAGARIVEEIIDHAPHSNPQVMILAGGGNNGGDGFVIARRLFDLGLKPILGLVVDPKRIKGDALVHYTSYKNRGLPIFHIRKEQLERLQDELERVDIIVDAMLGTGVKGPVRSPIDAIINTVNQYAGKKMILSVDIPSGLSSDDGSVEGVAIQATKTISFVLPKKGFFLQAGPNYIGEWQVVDISVPPSIIDDLHVKMPRLLTRSLIRSAIPKRPANGHKGTFGHVLVLGGSRSYVGAPIFAARSAFSSGAGLVTLAVPENIYPLIAGQNPEYLYLPLDEVEGHFADQAIETLSTKMPQMDTIALGPGMGRFPNGEAWMKSFFSILTGQSVVIDADALYLMRNQLDMLHTYEGDIIFTPHPGEMATLLKCSIKEVEKNRLEIAENFAKEYQLYLVLKGHRSIIATPDGKTYINPHGHDALSKGGSGDVLTGMIASFLAQGASAEEAIITAAYLHAKAGEEQAKRLSRYGVTPLDIIEGIRKQLNEMM